jgi:hypothetical protein
METKGVAKNSSPHSWGRSAPQFRSTKHKCDASQDAGMQTSMQAVGMLGSTTLSAIIAECVHSAILRCWSWNT